MLLSDDDSSASEVKVDDGGLHAESAAADEGLLDSLETAIEHTVTGSSRVTALSLARLKRERD